MGVLSHAFSGKHGSAKAAAVGGSPAVFYEVVGWKHAEKSEAPKHCSNLTRGMKVPIAGAFEGGGNIEVLLQSPGSTPFVLGYYDVELHVDDSGANYISGTVLITEEPFECEINGNSEVKVVYTFEDASFMTYYGILSIAGGSSGGSP